MEMVELFLDSGSDVNQLDSDKRTPLHIAVSEPNKTALLPLKPMV